MATVTRVRIGRFDVLRTVLGSQLYVGLAIAGALAYFLIFHAMITSSNYGIFLVTVPIWLVYAMVGSAGLLLSLSVFSVAKSLLSNASGAEEGFLSFVLPSIGGFLATCSCSFSLLASLLFLLGVNSLEVSGVVSFVSLYQLWLLIGIIAVNLILIYYYLGKLAEAECRLPAARLRNGV